MKRYLAEPSPINPADNPGASIAISSDEGGEKTLAAGQNILAISEETANQYDVVGTNERDIAGNTGIVALANDSNAAFKADGQTAKTFVIGKFADVATPSQPGTYARYILGYINRLRGDNISSARVYTSLALTSAVTSATYNGQIRYPLYTYDGSFITNTGATPATGFMIYYGANAFGNIWVTAGDAITPAYYYHGSSLLYTTIWGLLRSYNGDVNSSSSPFPASGYLDQLTASVISQTSTLPVGSYFVRYGVLGPKGDIQVMNYGALSITAANQALRFALGSPIASNNNNNGRLFAYVEGPNDQIALVYGPHRPGVELIVDAIYPAQYKYQMPIDLTTSQGKLVKTAYYQNRFFWGYRRNRSYQFVSTTGADAMLAKGNLWWSEITFGMVQPDNYIDIPGDIIYMAATTAGLYVFTRTDAYYITGSFSPLLNDTRVDHLPFNIGVDELTSPGVVINDVVIVISKGQLYAFINGKAEQIAPELNVTFTGVYYNRQQNIVYAVDSNANWYTLDMRNGTVTNHYWPATSGFSPIGYIQLMAPDPATGIISTRDYLEGSNNVIYRIDNASSWSDVVMHYVTDCGEPIARKVFRAIRFRTLNAAQVTVNALLANGVDSGTPIPHQVKTLPNGVYEIAATGRVEFYSMAFRISVTPTTGTYAVVVAPLEILYDVINVA